MKRRPFLHRIWSATGLLLVGGWGAISLRALGHGRRRDAWPTFPRALVEGLAAGEARREGDFLLRKDPEGQTELLSLSCTHLGCTLEVTATGFLCPCHRSRFDPAGEPLEGPARSRLARHRLERAGDRFVATVDGR